jgi:2-polyprenyl-3-methyl-5-hydroxy-6-metoxy-1,4-benzoquinol methylase
VLDTRSDAPETLDDFTLAGAELQVALRGVERVNLLLGGTGVLLSGFERALANPALARLERPLVVHDLGCAGGDGLRALARWARKSGRLLQLTGFDASAAALDLARERSREHPEIRFEQQDVHAPDYEPRGADVVTLNLCLHHFTDAEIEVLLGKCRRAGVRAVLVNDLHRHWLAYVLFHLFCFACFVPRIARVDGLLSVRKGFRKAELRRLARATGARLEELRWRWAFRYQMVLAFSQ